ncbi:unnamed protein product, partial [Tetraodon nigroviridis]
TFRRGQAVIPVDLRMFRKKKKKRPEISAPKNFEHRVHTSFDAKRGCFVGLPTQWQSLIENLRRPKPMVDPSRITEVELKPKKTIVRGSMIGHGDYIAAMINDMSRLSVTSSNSLRKSSPSARKRAQSLGRLGENIPVPSYEAYMSGELGSPQERVIWKRDFQLPRGMPPSQRPIACFYSPSMTVHQPLGDQTPVGSEARPTLPSYMHTQNSPGRPFSSYDLKVSEDNLFG